MHQITSCYCPSFGLVLSQMKSWMHEDPIGHNALHTLNNFDQKRIAIHIYYYYYYCETVQNIFNTSDVLDCFVYKNQCWNLDSKHPKLIHT